MVSKLFMAGKDVSINRISDARKSVVVFVTGLLFLLVINQWQSAEAQLLAEGYVVSKNDANLPLS
jgi:hypothetical protein